MCQTPDSARWKWAAAMLLALAARTAAAGETGIHWFDSYDKGMAVAKEQDKPVLLDFGAEWCVWCRKMDQEVYSEPGVRRALQDFVCIKVDVEKEPRVALAYGAEALPRTLFLNTYREVTADRVGFLPVEVFLDVVADAAVNARKQLGANAAPVVKSLETPDQVVERVLADGAASHDEALLTLLTDPDPAVRDVARQEVQATGEEAVPMLVQALSSDYLGARIASLEMLDALGVNPHAFDPWAKRPERAAAVALWERWLSDRLRAEYTEDELRAAVEQVVNAYRSRNGALAPDTRDRNSDGSPDEWTYRLGPDATACDQDEDFNGAADLSTVTRLLRPGRRLVVTMTLLPEGPQLVEYRIAYEADSTAKAAAEN